MIATSDKPVTKPVMKAKRTPNDFKFGALIGEGSFSSVYLAKEVDTGIEFAIKVCEKLHIVRQRKSDYIMREKELLTKTNHPFIVKLHYTFQDHERLYFVLQYAPRGELLYYLNKLSSFDFTCSQFYAAEIVVALEYLQENGIIHRDLKPENILLNERMHILVTDFGSAKVLPQQAVIDSNPQRPESSSSILGRRHSFVGTAQYVSPEVLSSKQAYFCSDLWALGCIIFQFLSGEPPFWGGHEYQIFQKICKLDFEIPEGFNEVAADLVSKLLVLDPSARFGCKELGGIPRLMQHQFFSGCVWENLHDQNAPQLMPYLPATGRNPDLWGDQTVTGFDDRRLAEIIVESDHRCTDIEAPVAATSTTSSDERLEEQRRSSAFHRCVEGNLIVKLGKVFKRKGLFARKRMLLLTEGPHLYYVDYSNMAKLTVKGEIPWSRSLRPEVKNFRVFFIHTPNRTYYLESKRSDAHDWEKQIICVWQRYYGNGH